MVMLETNFDLMRESEFQWEQFEIGPNKKAFKNRGVIIMLESALANSERSDDWAVGLS